MILICRIDILSEAFFTTEKKMDLYIVTIVNCNSVHSDLQRPEGELY